MKIKTVHKFKLPNNCKIKGLNFLCNRVTTCIENYIIKHNQINGCINPACTKKVIISLTSFPERTEELYYTLKSLLNQDCEVNKIIVWLASEQYPGRKISNKLRSLKKYGVEFLFCDDLKSHKKYYYAIQKFFDYILITVDDDVIYPENTVIKLLKCHERFPKSVVCNQARFIQIEGNKFKKYSKWPVKIPKECLTPCFRILPIGEGGILYPVNALYKDVNNKELIENYCLSADDLWLKYMEVMNNTKAVVSERFQRGLNQVVLVNKKEKYTLHSENVLGGKNDDVLNKLNKIYPGVFNMIRNEYES